MTTIVGASTSYQLTIPELSETADIQTALKLIAYGQSTDPTNNADIESNSLAGYIATKANIAGPTFTGTVVLPSTTSIGTITSTELGYLDGVTSAIQTQFGAKANLAGPTFTGTVVLPSTTSIGNVSSTEISYLDGVTSAIQTQIGTKANLAGPTFTGTVVLPSTTSIGTVTSTEIGYLDGVTSAIQTQIDNLVAGTGTYQPLDTDLTAIAGLAATSGVLTKTAADTWALSTSYYNSGGTDVALLDGGTNASLTASNGGIVYSTASAMAILAGTATAGQFLRSGASGAPSWSTATLPSTATGTGTILRADGTNWVATTATYPTTTTVNQILYSSSANTIAGLTTANSGVLVTSGTGVPSISTTIPAVTLTTPTVDTVNTSLTTSGTAALWNTGLTTGTISIGGALTTGTVNIASSTAGAKTVNIGTSTGTVNINGTANIGKALLQTVTTSAGASTLTFSSISQEYESLEVVYVVSTASTNTGTMTMQFSGDTSTNYTYNFQIQGGNATTNTNAPTYNNGFDQASVLVPITHTSNAFVGSFKIDNYTSTAGSKIGRFDAYQDYIGDTMVTGIFAWKNRTTAVTSMTLTWSGSTAGQVVTAKLYGLN